MAGHTLLFVASDSGSSGSCSLLEMDKHIISSGDWQRPSSVDTSAGSLSDSHYSNGP